MAHPILILAVAFAMMTLLWLPSLAWRDVSIIDILWAPAFAIVAFVCAFTAPILTPLHIVVLVLVTVWAARLGLHIFRRWKRLGHEDYRYAELRRKAGPNFPIKSLATIFWLQAALVWIISWPLQALFSIAPLPFNLLQALGILMVVAGTLIETIADAQLTRFRADPANKNTVLNTGIWAWSRHPNYFGDFTVWWGIFVIALGAGAPWWTAFGPVAMSALLIHYSGKGLMEDTIKNRRPGYAEYVQNTSGFIPLPPRKTHVN